MMTHARDLSTVFDYREFDVVETRAAIWSDGHIYPSGSHGTIVYVHKGGEAFEIEFAIPAPVVVTLKLGDLGAVQWRA